MKNYSILESALRLGGNNEEMITEANAKVMTKTKFLDYCDENNIDTTYFMKGMNKCFDKDLIDTAKFKTIPGSSEGQSFTCTIKNCGSFNFSIHDGSANVNADQFDSVIKSIPSSIFTEKNYGIREYQFY